MVEGNNKVFFRCDASHDGVGVGHLMRCLSLASGLRGQGAQCQFFLHKKSESFVSEVKFRGFDVCVMPDTTNSCDTTLLNDSREISWEVDCEILSNLIKENRPKWLIVDHYDLGFEWEKRIRPYCGRLMVIDDIARNHDCDILLDQNIVANFRQRYSDKIPNYCYPLLGHEYALLQRRYLELHSEANYRTLPVERVLIYFGGADIENFTEKSIDACLMLGAKDIGIDVVVHDGHQYIDSIMKKASEHACITVHSKLTTVADLIFKADLAIGSSGVSALERSCLGLPSIVITLAENQLSMAMELSEIGVISYIGQKDDVDIDTIYKSLRYMLSDENLLAMSKKSINLIDGKGVDRVVSLLTLDHKSSLRVRLAKKSDLDLLFRWANDPKVRKSAFNQKEITYAEHQAWFDSRVVKAKDCYVFIVETSQQVPIGQVRFDLRKDEWEIDYSLDACARGAGLAKHMMDLVLKHMCHDFHKVKKVYGLVRRGNIASKKVFESLGFQYSDFQANLKYSREC